MANNKLQELGNSAIGKLLSDDPLATVKVDVTPEPIIKIVLVLGVTLAAAGVVIAFAAKKL